MYLIPQKILMQLALIFIFTSPQSLEAHEFWLDAGVTRSVIGGSISADLKVGQELSGVALPYLDTTIGSMSLFSPLGIETIEARLGDRPAISDVNVSNNGLHVLTVETKPAYIVFDSMMEFEEYLAYEGLLEITKQHRSRGLPDTNIAEEYLRNARALVQVGARREGDSDKGTGMPLEIVVDGSPFADNQNALTVRLTWQGVAAPDIQIALFHLADGGTAPAHTTRTLVVTDGAGYAEFPMRGPGRYLLNAVRMEPADGPGSVVWRSHWASLTFEVETDQ